MAIPNYTDYTGVTAQAPYDPRRFDEFSYTAGTTAGAGAGASGGNPSGGGGIPWASLAKYGFAPAASTAASLYSGKKSSSAQREATAAQERANKAALAYSSQKDYEDALAAEAAQRGNYDQWRAAQETSNDLLQARERRMGALGSLIGAPERAPIRTNIPDYVPMPRRTRPSGSGTLADYLGQ